MQPEKDSTIICTLNTTPTLANELDEYGVIHSEDEFDNEFQGEVEQEGEEEIVEQFTRAFARSKITTTVTNNEMNQLAGEQGLSPRGIHYNPKIANIPAPASRPNTRLHNL